ncbi:conserved domain protein [Peptoniphilus sp. oral taxon 375 str. F0436]|nr:conserved domain protein [Peptoniphilus sp. oral taxon 375 str. F0436]
MYVKRNIFKFYFINNEFLKRGGIFPPLFKFKVDGLYKLDSLRKNRKNMVKIWNILYD